MEDFDSEQKEALEHLVRSVDSASESSLDGEDSFRLEEVVAARKKEDLIRVEADKTDESLLVRGSGFWRSEMCNS